MNFYAKTVDNKKSECYTKRVINVRHTPQGDYETNPKSIFYKENKTMKKILGLIASVAAVVMSAFALTACGGAKYPVTDGKFTIATNCPFGVYEYVENGKAYGIDIELAGLFAKQENLELVVKNIDFDVIFTQVQSGLADAGMAGITISETRMKTFDFSDTYADASQKLIVMESNTDFDDKTTVKAVEDHLKSLEGKKIGYQTGTTGGMYINGNEDFEFDGFENIEGKGYDTAVLAVNDMKNGNLYAVIVDDGPAAAIAANISGVKVIDVKLTDEQYAFVIKKGNSKLQKKFNEFLKKTKEDGTFDSIVAKYYEGKGEKVGYNVTTE